MLQESIQEQLSNMWQLLDQHCPLIQTSLCPKAYQADANRANRTNRTLDDEQIPLQQSWQEWVNIVPASAPVMTMVDGRW